MKTKTDSRRWQIDRRIPLAIIAALLSQVAAMLIWATQLEARVMTLEGGMRDLRQISERLGRMEERMEGLEDDLTAIRQQLDRLVGSLVRR